MRGLVSEAPVAFAEAGLGRRQFVEVVLKIPLMTKLKARLW